MKIDRVTKRVPSAKTFGYAKLMDKKLVFNKISTDGSGKANIIDSKNNVVVGVLFDLDKDEIMKLDEIEKGYERQDVTVFGNDEIPIHAFTYISTQTNDELIPYDWYLNFLIDGADENLLPKDYIDCLRRFDSMPDTRKK